MNYGNHMQFAQSILKDITLRMNGEENWCIMLCQPFLIIVHMMLMFLLYWKL